MRGPQIVPSFSLLSAKETGGIFHHLCVGYFYSWAVGALEWEGGTGQILPLSCPPRGHARQVVSRGTLMFLSGTDRRKAVQDFPQPPLPLHQNRSICLLHIDICLTLEGKVT